MIILNSLKILNHLSEIEEKIKHMEQLLKNEVGEIEGEKLLEKVFGQLFEADRSRRN